MDNTSAKIRVLYVGGGDTPYHLYQDQAPLYTALLERSGFEVHATDDLDCLLPDRLRDVDCIVLTVTGGRMTPAQSQGLREAVLGSPWGPSGAPKGFVGIHGASTAFQDDEAYLRMLGGRFLTHPEIGPTISVRVENTLHPVTHDITDFGIVDEFYQMELYPPFTTLLSSEFRGERVPLAWTKNYGRGKVVYLALGHDKPQIEHPLFARLVTQAVRYSVFQTQHVGS